MTLLITYFVAAYFLVHEINILFHMTTYTSNLQIEFPKVSPDTLTSDVTQQSIKYKVMYVSRCKYKHSKQHKSLRHESTPYYFLPRLWCMIRYSTLAWPYLEHCALWITLHCWIYCEHTTLATWRTNLNWAKKIY